MKKTRIELRIVILKPSREDVELQVTAYEDLARASNDYCEEMVNQDEDVDEPA